MQDAEALHLFERRQLLVDPADDALHFGQNLRRLMQRGAGVFDRLLHTREGFRHGGMDREESHQVRQAVARQQNLADQRLELEEALDARREDLLTVRRHNQLFAPAGDEDVAVGIDGSDVAAVQPAVAEELAGGFGVFVIAARKAGRAEHQFAVGLDFHIDAGEGLADAAGARRVERIQRHDAALGQAIALDQRHADGVVELGQIGAQRGGTRCGDAQASSEALANLLFGKTNFSGKLAISFPASDSDLPHASVAAPPGKKPGPIDGLLNAKTPFPAPYEEGLKVGYKWFDAENKKPAYPFGFGLSYTSFAYSDLKATGGASIDLSFSVRNTGKRAGEEVAQVYLSLPTSTGEPPKRLIGWEKVDLEPGESKTVTLKIDPLYLSIFDTAADRWTIAPGEYKVLVGPSSAALPQTAIVSVNPAGS